MQLNYTTIALDKKIYTIKGWFFLFSPISGRPYDAVEGLARKEGFLTSQDLGIFEKSKFIGKGLVGVEVLEGDFNSTANILQIRGDFNYYEYTGSYKGLKKIYKQIMHDFPEAKEYYAFYPNSPKETVEEELITRIVFR